MSSVLPHTWIITFLWILLCLQSVLCFNHYHVVREAPGAPAKTVTVKPLAVSAQNQEIQLPEDAVTLQAYVVPEDKDDVYVYQWSLLSSPGDEDNGEMKGIDTPNLSLSKLKAGVYNFKVVVSTDDMYGEDYVNVTVLAPARLNVSPVAVIKPESQSVNQPNDVVLDGSESTDDDAIVKYHWEQVSSPMNTPTLEEEDLSKQTLMLKDLVPGNYKFKLTVTDSDGVENSTFANVTVIKETDYPPKANAGSNVILSLPVNSISLYGNASTDDKGIVSYEWIKQSDDKLTADMTGTRTPVLHLENLEVGDYKFTLKVTDSAGQTDTADISVFVKPEHNKPPVANAGIDQVVWMPTNFVTLNGSNSTDDQKISTYLWTLTSGPNGVSIENSDRVIASASNLIVGEYKFKLTVTDEEQLTSSSTVTVFIKENINLPPKANAGGDKVVTLPAHLVVMDGTKSSDDKGIVTYTWTRSEQSLAAGDVLNNSDHQAVLQLTNLVAGRYVFTLEVIDTEGLKNTDTASVIVKKNLDDLELVEIFLDTNIMLFTQSNKVNLENQLSLLLHTKDEPGDPHVDIQAIKQDTHTGKLIVEFYVSDEMKDTHIVRPGPEVAAILKKKLKAEDVLDFPVIHVDTVVCQNNCSGHGNCDQATKLCMCEAFWMENFFKSLIFDDERNCEWSILYVTIVTMVVFIGTAALVWAVICACKKWHRARPKKRHRYSLLEDVSDDRDNVEMLPKGKLTGKFQSSSLMISESDFSSDEETLFVNHKKTNGHLKNGLTKHKSKIKA